MTREKEMDEYDEGLVRWFDREFWPMIARERAQASRLARESVFARPYWEGYLDAIDMVNAFVDEGVCAIRDSVEEDTNDD